MDDHSHATTLTEPPQPANGNPDWTLGGLLDWTARYLSQKGMEFPRLDAEVLLAHVAGCRRIDLYGERFALPASEQLRQSFKELIRKRLEGCPVAYLVGRKEFFSQVFEVSPAVLIPRPDTELVVVECLNRAKRLAAARIVDIGTGSGNIAISIAKRLPQAQIAAVDLSGEALCVARRNAERLGVLDQVRFLQGDLFGPLPAGEPFDFVLSNPPYIAREDLEQLPAGVRNYEPHMALDGGQGGYEIFDRLIEQARDFLVPGGYLIVEIGAPQESSTRRHIEDLGCYDLADTIRDLSGHPRVLCARRK